MEKNQQNHSEVRQPSDMQEKTGGQQPGQQILGGQQANLDQPPSAPGTMEQHSESSFPQQDNETLGTP